MRRNEITRRLRKILKKDFPQVKCKKLSDDLMDNGLDSITTIELVVKIEEEFNFEFFDEDLLTSNFSTLQAIVDYIDKRLSEQKD